MILPGVWAMVLNFDTENDIQSLLRDWVLATFDGITRVLLTLKRGFMPPAFVLP